MGGSVKDILDVVRISWKTLVQEGSCNDSLVFGFEIVVYFLHHVRG